MTSAFLGAFESPAIAVVAIGVLVLASLSFAACATLLVHHAISELGCSRRLLREERALAHLAPVLVGGEDLAPAAGEAIARFGRAAVATVLRSSRNELAGEQGRTISRALEAIGEVDRLERGARSRFSWRRITALRELGECGGDAALAALLAALNDPEWQARRAARDGLLASGEPAAIRAAIDGYLTDPCKDWGWWRSFFIRLATVAPSELRRLADSGRLGHADEKLALEALGDVRDWVSTHLACRRLTADDAELRASAARMLGKLGGREVVPLLVERLADPEWFVRAAAARSLGALPVSEESLVALGRCLNDRVWWVRANAARGLALAGARGFDQLRDAMVGDDAYARDAALAALATSTLAKSEVGNAAGLPC